MKEFNTPDQFKTLIPCLATYFLELSAQLLQKLDIEKYNQYNQRNLCFLLIILPGLYLVQSHFF